jgi:hypothetical protein
MGEEKTAPAPPDRILTHAQQLLEACHVPVTPAIRNDARAALECEIKTGKTLEEAFQYIVAGAQERSRYGPLRRFFFQDCGWRYPRGEMSASAVERDYRKLQAALDEVYVPLQGAYIVEEDPPPAGAYSRAALFRRACQRAGITEERGLELVTPAQAKKLPHAVNE